MPQAVLAPEVLGETVAGLLTAPERLAEMSRAAAGLACPDAAARLAALCLELAGLPAGEARGRVSKDT
jgi:UDP-N-acetylglucosamine:LPS N-acetylglucosamine transferase